MKLIVLTGLPGTGKSSIAEAIGRERHIPVFAKDWLEGVLIQSELKAGNANKSLGYAAYDLLTSLATRQLQLGQSVVLDSVLSIDPIRVIWKTLAQTYAAQWRVIECICSDEATHRARLANRTRGIPGWHELDWSEVERVRTYYAAWGEPRLILDAMDAFDGNWRKALDYLI